MIATTAIDRSFCDLVCKVILKLFNFDRINATSADVSQRMRTTTLIRVY